MNGKTAVVLAFGACCLLPSLAAASEDSPGAPKPAAAASAPVVPKGRELGTWWQKNALEYKPLPAQWLFHAEGTLSYMDASGNTSGSSVDAMATMAIRKHRFTSSSFAQLSRKDLIYGFPPSPVDYVERTLREQVDYAVTARVKVVAGVEYYRNTLIFMDKRLDVYVGMGATVLRNEKLQLTLTGGVGHASFSFDRAEMARVGLTDTDPSSGGVIGVQACHWRVSPRFSFDEDASYMKYFDSYLGRRWTINVAGNLPVSKHFSLNLSYHVKEEDNTIIEALGAQTLDRSFLLGIRAAI